MIISSERRHMFKMVLWQDVPLSEAVIISSERRHMIKLYRFLKR